MPESQRHSCQNSIAEHGLARQIELREGSGVPLLGGTVLFPYVAVGGPLIRCRPMWPTGAPRAVTDTAEGSCCLQLCVSKTKKAALL